MRRITARFFTHLAFGSLLLFFSETSLAVSIPQSYEGSVSRVFNDPTGDQINPGDPVNGTLTYNPSSTETSGSLTNWSFIFENFTLESNSSAFSYFEQDPGFWIFDLTGDIGVTIGNSDFDGSVWIMLDGDFSDFSTSAPPTFGDLVGRLGGGQLTFFVEAEVTGQSLFEIEIRSENIAVVPVPASLILLLSALASLAVPAWRKR